MTQAALLYQHQPDIMQSDRPYKTIVSVAASVDPVMTSYILEVSILRNIHAPKPISYTLTPHQTGAERSGRVQHRPLK